MKEFSSDFRERLSNFLDYRTARGYKRETYLRHFIKFDCWCIENHPGQTQLSRELVLDWINDATVSGYNTAQRVASMRQFARYLCAVGEEAYILPEKYTPRKSRAVAYLFTDMELTALFSAIDHLPPTKKEPFLNEVAPALYRLIYTCGLRPNEGRELLAENINLETGEILITHTKRNKERFVVMSDDMLTFARRYEQRRRIFCCENPYFFPSANGGPLTTETVYSAFNRAWSHADLAGKYPGKVRVYDLSYPNLNKIQTFQKKDVNRNKYRLKKFGYYFYLFLLIPQKSTREPSGFFHFADTFLSFSSSRVASAVAFSSTVISR